MRTIHARQAQSWRILPLPRILRSPRTLLSRIRRFRRILPLRRILRFRRILPLWRLRRPQSSQPKNR